MTERDLFLAALDVADPTARAALLDRTCRDDAALRRRIDGLLAAADRPGRFMDNPAANLLSGTARKPEPADDTAAADCEPATPTPDRPSVPGGGTVGGKYHLVEEVGEGGMGTVWLAQQTDPVKRLVAVKLIKAGMDSDRVLARFEAERQALALMNHPNIAKVLDAGATETGRPYFVMELVQGVPLIRYCDDQTLPVSERLALFVQVCGAVQHAHQKGIIHRDLKPTNILVESRDGKPVPKVIDFGLAKATGGVRLTEDTLFTAHGTVVGTPLYMAPEQAVFGAADVDTRADIYALGVLLFELLTGSTPIRRETFGTAGYSELLRMVREVESPTPSQRLIQMRNAERGMRNQDKAAARGFIPNSEFPIPNLRELDWIVMKALAKDRDRRYESAAAFAQDVERFLNHEPVSAGPPTAAYRLRKFVERNKGRVAAAAVLLLALVGGVIGTAAGLVEARRQERAAVAAAVEAEAAWAAEARERAKAVTERDDKEKARAAEAAARHRADHEAGVARAINDLLLRDLLFQAAPEKNARDKKVTVEELLDRAAARIPGRFEKQPLIEAAVRNTIGHAYRKLGNLSAAQPHLERALELRLSILGEEHPDTLYSLFMLAGLYRERGLYAKAEPLFVKVLEVRRRLEGDEGHETLSAMNNVALLYQAQGRFAEAEPLYRKVLEVRRRVLGDEHRDMLNPMNNMAHFYAAQGQYEKAEPLYVKALDATRRVLGEEHPSTLISIGNLAAVYHQQRKFEQAEPLYVQVLEASRRIQGEEHPSTLMWMSNLASLHFHRDQLAQAEALNDKVLQGRRRVLGHDHPDTLTSMNHLAAVYQAQRRFDRAEAVLRECLTVREKADADGWRTFHTKSLLGGSLLGRKRYAEAEPLLLAGYAGLKQREGAMPPPAKARLPEAADRLVELYTAWGRAAEAAKWRGVRSEYPPEQAPPPREIGAYFGRSR